MKQFKQFRSEQQVINEVGPIGATMMAAMGIFGGGLAAYKLFKTAKTAIKGYRETKAEKKANRESGVEIEVKKINPDTGEEYEELVTLTGSDANLSSDGVEKKRKELQKKYDNSDKGRDKKSANEKIRAALGKGPKDIITKDDQKKGMNILSDPEGTGIGSEVAKARDKKEKEAKDAAEKEKKAASDAEKGVGDWVGEPIDDIPADMVSDVKEKERRAIGGHKDVLAYKDRWGMKPDASIKGWKKWVQNPDKPKDFEFVSAADYDKKMQQKKNKTKKDTSIPKEKKPVSTGQGKTDAPKGALKTLAKQQGISSQNILSFGEFISEDVMKDLKKATKSKKDSEITLDDGADIPIDPLTASILVKYIEGLGSSEKSKTINKIQRTERAFMKVLGQAHGE